MAYSSSQLATMPRALPEPLLLAELQAEARLERAMDDDTIKVSNPMDSAQSRREQWISALNAANSYWMHCAARGR